MRIIVDANLTERVQHSLSPSRAKRRARLGHPQHFAYLPATKAYKVGDTIIVHPAVYAALKAETRLSVVDRQIGIPSFEVQRPLFGFSGFGRFANPIFRDPGD